MKKSLLALCLMAGMAWADSETNRLDLTLPTVGSPSWATKTNNNWQIIDSTVAGLGATNNFTSSTSFHGPTQIDNLTAITVRATTVTVTGLTPNQCVQTDSSGRLSSTGNQCGTPSGGGTPSLQVTQSGVQITSPTSSMNFNGSYFSLSSVGSTSTVTMQPTISLSSFSATNLFGSKFVVTGGSATISQPIAGPATILDLASPLVVGSNGYIEKQWISIIGPPRTTTPLVMGIRGSNYIQVNDIDSVSGAVGINGTQNGTAFYVKGNAAIGSGVNAAATSSAGPNGLYVEGYTNVASSLTVSNGIYANAVTIPSFTPGQCVQAGAGGILSVTGSACSAGSGATLTSTNTWTAQQTFARTVTVSSHVVITSSDTQSALSVVGNGGNYGTTNGASGAFLAACNQSGTQGNCAQVYSNAGAQNALTGVLSVIQDNPAWNTTTLYVSAAGTDPQNGIRVDGRDYATLELIDTKQTSPGGKFQFSSHNNQFRGERRNAANDAYESIWTAPVSTKTTGGLMFVGTDYSNAASTLAVGGNLIVGDGYAGDTTGGHAPINGALIQGHILAMSSMTVATNLTATSVTSSSLTLTGVGNLSVNTPSGLGQVIVSTLTVDPTSGHTACFGSSNTIVDCGTGAIPGGSSGQVQYNSAGTLAGSNNFQFNGSSVTAISSVTIRGIVGGGDNSVPALLNVFNGNSPAAGTSLLTVGSNVDSSAFYVPSQGAVVANNGMTANNIGVGRDAAPDQVVSINSLNNALNLWDGTFSVTLKTNSGAGPIRMIPHGTETVTLSSTSATVLSSMTVSGTNGLKVNYGVIQSSSVTNFTANTSPGTSGSYHFRLLPNGGSDIFGIGADGSNVYLQSFGGAPLQINNQGNSVILSTVTINSGGSANQTVCWKPDGKTLGFCSSVVSVGGACTCN